ncbi:autotransporter outer membrane beta-barrel domain-containing protein [Achromobacter insolitus]|uniref:autotransporter outer membrane beta-barrel domain-containing protein n=1 Tax=Achromobacter insolitus TaxID=217204 RepID=UPI00174A6AEB|nr:autotransporter outer membrane beta-barrel domain-containing protein [Achromobacter insolitus]
MQITISAAAVFSATDVTPNAMNCVATWPAFISMNCGMNARKNKAVTASAKTQSYTTALYVGRSFATRSGALYLLAGAAYSWHDIDTRRQVRYGSMDQTLTANYTGNTTQLFAETGYSMHVAPTVTLEPFVGLSWNDLRVRGFSESGGTAALSGSAQRQDNTSTLAGVRAQWAPSQTDIQLRGMLGWRHAYGSLQATQTLAFDQGVPFSVAGAPIARDAARVAKRPTRAPAS